MEGNLHMHWSTEQTKCFIELCIEEINRVGRFGGSLQKESWPIVGKKLMEICNLRANQKQMKNLYDQLKAKHVGWVYLRNKTGNLYNPNTNMFQLNDEEWKEFFKGHPKARTLKTVPLPFPELCSTLFEGASATGAHHHAPSSTRERSRVGSSQSFTSLLNSSDIDDDYDDDDNEEAFVEPSAHPPQVNSEPSVNPPQANSEPSASHRRPKKKNKVTTNPNEELASEISSALKVLVSHAQEQNKNTFDVCVDKLNTLGLDPSDPLHDIAFDIFAYSESYQRAWLRISEDPVKLKSWIERTGVRLGFM